MKKIKFEMTQERLLAIKPIIEEIASRMQEVDVKLVSFDGKTGDFTFAYKSKEEDKEGNQDE